MSGIGYACDVEEDDEETGELRLLVIQFDDLYFECIHRRLIPEEVLELDKLFECLQEKEDNQWVGVSPHIVEIIFERLGVHFPMVRYLLNMLPDNYSE